MSSYFRGTAVVLALAFAGWHAYAAPVTLDRSLPAKLRKAAATKQPVVISGIDLGEASLSQIELELMQVWTSDSRIVVHQANGETELASPPRILSFKGRVVGDADSAVYVALSEDGTVNGSLFKGERQYQIATARRVRLQDRLLMEADAPIILKEYDAFEQQIDTDGASWSCGVEGQPLSPLATDEVRATKLRIEDNAGSVAGASYSLRLAIDTDTELYTAFGSTGAVTTYLTNLVGQASVIYQRDLATTLTIGHLNVYSGGTDPWAGTAASGTGALLAELGAYWANTDTANYKQVQRSTVVMISGKLTSGGVAWLNTLCEPDFFCGATGSNCGSGTYANSYAGGYAFCGSSGSVSTVVPDPNLTVNGVQYGLPASNYWMLTQFAHELGHNVGSQHTHCVTLTAGEQATYGVTRSYVDICYSGQGGCYSGATSAPTELGSIMSYCHNISSGGLRQSRFTFGKAGETSSKMLTILKGDNFNGLEGATPNPTITTQASPVACSAGRTASVTSCAGCTYAWQITGGSITTATNINAITYTPSATSVTLTVTVTGSRGCSITASTTVATSCSAVVAPTNVAATATTGTNILVSWTAASGATSYNVYRTADNVNWTQVSTPGAVVGTTFNNAVSANLAYKYKLRAVSGVESSDSNTDHAVALVWTDPTLAVGTTAVKAAHVTELRSAVNALRALNANQSAFPFTDNVLTATTTMARAVHVTELQTQLNVIRLALGASAIVFTETPVAGATAIKATHLAELRLGAQ